MNKQEFLKDLQSRIRILADAEQQDILAEYAQHIDLRTASGLSEEEAIRDFGDPGQLASEILEAYHVDPARLMAEPSGKEAADMVGALRRAGSKAGGTLRRLGIRIASSVCSIGQRLSAGVNRLGRWTVSFFHQCGLALRRLFRRPSQSESTVPQSVKEDPHMNVVSTPSHRGHQVLRAVKRLCTGLLRLLWNLLLALCAVPFIAAGMLALVGIGLLAVLLIQGYPLIGILLCCLGAVLCCAAILGLGITLIWHRPLPAENPEESQATEASPAEIIVRTVELAASQPEREEVNHHA